MATSAQTAERRVEKSAQAFRTISEVAGTRRAAACAPLLGKQVQPGPSAETRRRTTRLSARGYRPAAPHPHTALRGWLYHQGRAAPPEGGPRASAPTAAAGSGGGERAREPAHRVGPRRGHDEWQSPT